ncbi:unnamed protein product [Parnassius mnemosyne]|uniref:Uncharacterized protein n=1 Tax=Parnassius mnemosyne TaxID=213953 RepID=A0AAV1LB14_9NEOP
MLNLPVIQRPDNYNLKKMHDVITECLNGLANIGIETSTWDPLMVQLMSQKLNTSTYADYMREQQDHRELPDLNDFLFFLESKFMAYETMKNLKKEIPNVQKQGQQKTSNYKNFPTKKHFYETKKGYNKTYFTTSTIGQCPNCKGGHVLMQCVEFIDMNAIQHNNTVAKLHVCANCLYSHGNAKCTSTKTCKGCNKRHHTLLHNYTKKNASTAAETTNGVRNKNISRPTTSTQLNCNHLTNDNIRNPTYYRTTAALLDQGSQVNLITESAA